LRTYTEEKKRGGGYVVIEGRRPDASIKNENAEANFQLERGRKKKGVNVKQRRLFPGRAAPIGGR